MPELDFPTDPDDVTAEWLASVLGLASVHDLRHERVGAGLMARSHRYSFEGPDGAMTVVGKFPSVDAATRELGARAYTREVSFYRDLSARAGARVPRCHAARIDETGSAFVLVLEDLAPAVPGDQIRGCGRFEAERSVDNLALLHAATWGGAGCAGLPWMTEDRGVSLADYMAIAHPVFLERFEDRLEPSTLDVLAAFTANADAWAASHPSTTAAVHGDYRLDNLMFAPDGAVAAVDWQTVSLANPGRDLAYFLGNSLTVPDRRRHESALIDRYHDALAAAGVTGYARERCQQDYRHGMFQGPLVTMLGAFTAEQTERGEHMFAAMADRCAAQILDHAALDLLT